jgi:hypothetical protein
MPAFVEILDQPTDAYGIAVKPASNDEWEIHPTLFPTEASATLEAIALMGPPSNYFATRVLVPSGTLFKEAI